MIPSAVMSSRWALSRWCLASSGRPSLSTWLSRLPISNANSTIPAVSEYRRLNTRSLLRAKPDLDLVAVHRGSDRRAGREHARKRDLPPVVADLDRQLAVVAGKVDVGLVHERQLEREHILASDLLDALRGAQVE